jgi:hypothetical protein
MCILQCCMVNSQLLKLPMQLAQRAPQCSGARHSLLQQQQQQQQQQQ